jgi:hypothetical protein
MSKLSDDLELLYQLNDLRHRAKKLRRGGLDALRRIGDVNISGKVSPLKEGNKYYDNWITSGNEVEVALLVRVQNHRDMSEEDEDNNKDGATQGEATSALKDRLKKITLKSLFPSLTKTIKILDAPEGQDTDEYIDLRVYKKKLGESKGGTVTDKFLELVDSTVPVLVAARAMHALVGRAETVFHRATMICYYRIVRELYFAVQPDWIIGAARANAGSDASAFVTGECIRAILAFENSIKRAVVFFRNTRDLHIWHKRIREMLDGLGAGPGHPLSLWADKAIERIWLDWYISTNPRRSEIAVKQVLTALPDRANMETVGEYLAGLPDALKQYVEDARNEIKLAQGQIDDIRAEQYPYQDEKDEKKPPEGEKKRKFKPDYGEEEERVYQQTESAHSVAYRAIGRGITETSRAHDEFFAGGDLEHILEEFAKQFEDISRRIHRILEPAKRYVRTVVNRELAFAATDESGRFDLHLPVYHPDPLSRAGGFLYRTVGREPAAAGPAAGGRKEREERLLDMIEDTSYAAAGELAEAYFNYDRDPACFEYYFSGGVKGYRLKEREVLGTGDGYSKDEKEERKSINEWEGRLKAIPRDKDAVKLSYCLSPKS